MDRRRVLTWTCVSVCALCILLAGFSATVTIARDGETPAQREASDQDNGKTMRVRLMHRNALESPFRNHDETRLESLRSLLRDDRLRLSVFEQNGVREPSGEAEAPYYFTEPGEAGRSGAAIRAPMFSGSFVGSGQYFVDMHIGTPSRRFLLIADTGSDLVWVNCRYHAKAPHRNSAAARFFDAATSSTFSPVSCAAEECQLVPPPPRAPCRAHHPTSCKYMYNYSDRSASSGVFAYETLTINATSAAGSSGGIRIPSVAMGCSTRHHGQSFRGADGVIGLGQGPISFPSQIGYMYGDKFSYCLPDHLNSPWTSSNYLVFGERNVDHLKSALQYTAFLKNPPTAPDTFYYVGIQGVNINGIRLPIPRSAWLVDRSGNRGTIVDSGTTLTYILEPAYRVFLAAIEPLVCYPRLDLDPFDLCFNSSGIANPRLPSFSIDFDGGACFRPHVDNYFIDAAPDIKCLGILGSSALKVVSGLWDEGCVPTVVTGTRLLDGLCRAGKAKEAFIVLKRMLECGILPDGISWNSVLELLCNEDRMDEAKELWLLAVSRGWECDAVTYNILLHGFCKQGRVNEGADLVNKMLDNDFIHDLGMYNRLMDGLNRSKKVVGHK